MASLVFIAFTATADPTLADLYLMGLLNAVLFVHRSGFRVRFHVAALSTSLLTVPIVVLAFVVLPRALATECTMYIVVGLGCMTLHEEEVLRRDFFVLKSIRTVECFITGSKAVSSSGCASS
ncbi:hypothetical protein DYB32_004847 [Aphanomyces invadans]|uniref:Uncharacterized protein n=1 Tax=Aphanomyces invadans TaxID=157072 RepID=A0A418AW91_9STRA|nr:hypothetical protein DYB32_004847 [Aphanomyces invadans]